MKNAWGKTRKQGNAYYVAVDGSWRWEILKAYQSSDKAALNQYARVFCAVSSPMTMGGVDLGDVYVRDIPNFRKMLEVQAMAEGGAESGSLMQDFLVTTPGGVVPVRAMSAYTAVQKVARQQRYNPLLCCVQKA